MADVSLGMDGPPAGLRDCRGAGKGKRNLPVFRDNESGFAFWRSVQAPERRDVALFMFATRGDVRPLGGCAT